MELLLGAHISIAGGIDKSFLRSNQIGGNTMQIFAKSPRGRKIPEINQEDIKNSLIERKKYSQVGGLIHSNYLANLSKPLQDCQTDIDSIIHDLKIAQQTGFDGVNVHIGKGKGFLNKEEAMENMRKNVEYILSFKEKLFPNVQFLFENTAGQGSELGSNLEELDLFMNKFMNKLDVKLTIDTCHSRAGGIDITKFDKFISDFESKIGLEKLYCFHLNDAKVPLGSNLDRHASFGRGFIGVKGLRPLIERAFKNNRAMYLETPNPDLRPSEIEMIKKIVLGDTKRIDDFDKKHLQTDVLKKYENYSMIVQEKLL